MFSEWIFEISDAASTVVSVVPTTKNANVNTYIEKQPAVKIKCFMCKGDHKITMCSEFKNLSLDKKWGIVKKNNLCRTCLNKHNGCVINHHKLLYKYANEITHLSSGQVQITLLMK